MISRLLIVAFAVATLVPAGAAHARGRTRLVSQTAGPVISDGSRYLAFRAPGGALRIYDARAGARRDVAVADDCRVQDGSFGRFLLTCGQEPVSAPYVLDAATGAVVAMPVSEVERVAARWERIGRWWIRGLDCGSGHCGPTFVNVRTLAHGTPKGVPYHDDPFAVDPGPHLTTDPAFREADLDDPQLRIRRPRQRWFVSGRRTLTVRFQRGRRVWRAGACRPDCRAITLSDGVLTWLLLPAASSTVAATSAVAWDTRTRRTSRLTVGDVTRARGATLGGVVALRGRLYAQALLADPARPGRLVALRRRR